MNDTICRRILIHGLVQGVGFRYSMRHEALRLGLTGWVKNRRGGSVEAVVSGPAPAVATIVAWAHKGPPSARVESVNISIAEGVFDSFDLVSTD